MRKLPLWMVIFTILIGLVILWRFDVTEKDTITMPTSELQTKLMQACDSNRVRRKPPQVYQTQSTTYSPSPSEGLTWSQSKKVEAMILWLRHSGFVCYADHPGTIEAVNFDSTEGPVNKSGNVTIAIRYPDNQEAFRRQSQEVWFEFGRIPYWDASENNLHVRFYGSSDETQSFVTFVRDYF